MVERCKRCNRPLLDEESLKRGYGPLCWEKVKAGNITIKNRGLKTTILDPCIATETRFKILDRILGLKASDSKCSCGTRFAHCTLKSYNHSDGVPAAGYKYPQWFYLHCDTCNHDTAILKLPLKLDDLAGN